MMRSSAIEDRTVHRPLAGFGDVYLSIDFHAISSKGNTEFQTRANVFLEEFFIRRFLYRVQKDESVTACSAEMSSVFIQFELPNSVPVKVPQRLDGIPGIERHAIEAACLI